MQLPGVSDRYCLFPMGTDGIMNKPASSYKAYGQLHKMSKFLSRSFFFIIPIIFFTIIDIWHKGLQRWLPLSTPQWSGVGNAHDNGQQGLPKCPSHCHLLMANLLRRPTGNRCPKHYIMYSHGLFCDMSGRPLDQRTGNLKLRDQPRWRMSEDQKAIHYQLHDKRSTSIFVRAFSTVEE